MSLAIIRPRTDDEDEATMLLARERDGAVESYSNSADGRALKDLWEYLWSNGIENPVSVLPGNEKVSSALAVSDETLHSTNRKEFLAALSMELYLAGWQLREV